MDRVLDMTGINTSDMWAMTNAFPELLGSIGPSEESLSALQEIREHGVQGVCLLGMGGSSITGEICRGLLQPMADVPIISVRDYAIPACINEHWVTIAVSYSGNTEETINALADAIERGTTAVVITSGGRLAELAKQQIMYHLPTGFQPRAALPLILSLVLPSLETLLGMSPTDLSVVAERLMNDQTWKMLPAPKELAEHFRDRIPLFIGSGHMIPVAYRAKCQINENAKTVAFHSEIPESNHNEIEASVQYGMHKVLPVFLRSGWESARIMKRIDETAKIYQKHDITAVQLRVEAHTTVTEAVAMIYYLDKVSVRLAQLLGVDPLSVPMISDLKSRLQ